MHRFFASLRMTNRDYEHAQLFMAVSLAMMIRMGFGIIAAVVGLLMIAPLLIVGLPLLGGTWITRRLAKLLEPSPVPWQQLVEFDRALGWKPKPNIQAHHLVDDVFTLSTDQDGWRGKAIIQESPMVILGDSFVWGYGIDDRKFFADLIPELPIKAVGTIGYSMVQEVLWMEHHASRLKGKCLVWCVYYGNDLYDNLVPNFGKYRRPWVRRLEKPDAWEIIDTHIAQGKWPLTFAKHTQVDYYQKLADLCSDTVLAERAYSACKWLIRRGRDICNRHDIQLMVLSIPEVTQLRENGVQVLRRKSQIPDTFDPRTPDQKLGEICYELGVPFGAGKDFLDSSHYKISDCHWNEAGHARVASMLKRMYKEMNNQNREQSREPVTERALEAHPC